MEFLAYVLGFYFIGAGCGYFLGRLHSQKDEVDLEERSRAILAPAEAAFKWRQQEFERQRLNGQSNKNYYVRYFIEDMSWWVCRDDEIQCHKLTGPWDTKRIAMLSLEMEHQIDKESAQ